jgi:hypothetical protein
MVLAGPGVHHAAADPALEAAGMHFCVLLPCRGVVHAATRAGEFFDRPDGIGHCTESGLGDLDGSVGARLCIGVNRLDEIRLTVVNAPHVAVDAHLYAPDGEQRQPALHAPGAGPVADGIGVAPIARCGVWLQGKVDAAVNSRMCDGLSGAACHRLGMPNGPMRS